MIRKLIIIAVVGLAIAGCGGTTAADQTQAEATTQAESRCLPVPKPLVRGIAEGLTVTGGGKLGRAAAVRSEDFEKVFYVSAVIRGPGLGSDTVGTWATNSLKVGEGLIMAADAVAMEFSDWGSAAAEGSPAAEVRGLENDGAQESRDCLP